MENRKIIIAIDGYSSTGKSTFAKQLARKLGYIYVDTGAMYRAVTFYCIENKIIGSGEIDKAKVIAALANINISFVFNNASGKSETMLNGKNIETEIRKVQVSNRVSAISAIAEVRTKMVALQQQMGANKGLVMDGRDIGTVVFPNAELKIFMTADPKVRAMRRYKELTEKGDNVTFEEIEKNVLERDYIDTHRDVSPLCQASDAIVLDNSNLTPDEQMRWFENIWKQKFEK